MVEVSKEPGRLAWHDGESLVVRNAEEGCAMCGEDGDGVMVPIVKDVATAYEAGMVVCQHHYEKDIKEKFSDNYEYHEFGGKDDGS